ncbi:enoyl-CoA hydratase/isomerase family protein [Paraburkholderia sp. J63]|uniref:enoyl-CoA hydratase/isomerase family protein n=1 Tax=Paraburkholderia sp. J63 TaxID=2805434 RepID=UPI002ABD392D|nr:enoyl-CoA hydratase-related protein [Paraburkholderia sp. J63]
MQHDAPFLPPHDTPDRVRCWHRSGVAHIRLNRPQALNALDEATALAFRDACRAVAADSSVRAVVLSGEGRAFCVGGDLASMRERPVEGAHALIRPMHEAIVLLAAMPAPVIASVQGAVAGGGLGLALAADLCIAAEGTRFDFAYAKVGTSPDCSTSWTLPRLVGLRKAAEIALLGERFDADEALRLGIVNRVVAAADLETATQAMASRLADGPPVALARTRQLLRASLDRSLDEQLAAELAGFLSCAATTDFSEGLDAFFEKRAARFVGRTH